MLTANADAERPEPESGDEQLFLNEDGSLATWLEAVPVHTRLRTFAWRTSIGLLVTCVVWLAQYGNGDLDTVRGLLGLLPLAIGFAFGKRAYQGSATVRRYSCIPVKLCPPQRFRKAFWWWLWGTVIAGLIWWVQPAYAQFGDYWWYAWPGLPFFIVGIGLYLLKSEAVLTAAAKKAKVYFDNLEQQSALQRQATRSKVIDALFESALVRYPFAALCLYGTYYFATAPNISNGGWFATGTAITAAVLARELSKALLFLALVGAIVWALVAGMSALPVSAAIIIGALIIADAQKK